MAKEQPKPRSANTGLQSALDLINKQYGNGSIFNMGDDYRVDIDTFSTGAINLDVALGAGGLPRGRVVEVYGPESCLHPKTFIQYEVRTSDGCRQNHKGGTIERLYHRFHGILQKGKGNYQRLPTIDSEFFAPSVNEFGRIFQNEIIDVVSCGVKETFRVVTTSGHSVQATADHKFFTGDSFVPLSDLHPGDIVAIHDSTSYTVAEAAPSWDRAYVYVAHHPVAGVKLVEGGKYRYHRLLRSRAVVEAQMNSLSFDDYIEALNSGLEGLQSLPRHLHVHHLDEDRRNDSLDNLAVIDPESHGRHHAIERHNDLRYAISLHEIASIESAGETPTYDIRMASPFNNFVADDFVVHNSGKTTLALHSIADAQAKGNIAAFVDVEHALDPVYAAAIGVDMGSLLVSQPDTGEQALDIVDLLVRSGEVGIIVIDSVAALTPRAEIEGNMGDSHIGLQARLMSQALRKLTGNISKTNTLVIFINQLREKIGVIYGSPEITSGGKALKFYASVRLDIRRRDKISEGGEAVGNITKVKVVKNKVGPPFREVEFNIIYGHGIDGNASLVDLASDLGIVKKSGAWYSFDGDNIGQGIAAAGVYLAKNPEVKAKIDRLVRAAMNGGEIKE